MAKYVPVINVDDALNDRVDKVRSAIDNLDSPVALNYTRAVYEDHVIYEVVPNGQAAPGMARKTYKRNYTVDANGAVVLGNDLQEVVERRTFEPVGNEGKPDGEAKGCGCGEPTEALNQNTEGGEKMAKNTPERKAKVDVLLAANAGFTDTDREMLESLECNQFAAIEALAARPSEIPPPAIIDNAEALLAAVSPELKQIVEVGTATLNEQRTVAITTIKANTANPFTDEQLEGKSLCELTALAKLAANVAPAAAIGDTSFAANAGGAPPAAATGNEAAKVEPMVTPKINWEQK